jgi:hypothetical protein
MKVLGKASEWWAFYTVSPLESADFSSPVIRTTHLNCVLPKLQKNINKTKQNVTSTKSGTHTGGEKIQETR